MSEAFYLVHVHRGEEPPTVDVYEHGVPILCGFVVGTTRDCIKLGKALVDWEPQPPPQPTEQLMTDNRFNTAAIFGAIVTALLTLLYSLVSDDSVSSLELIVFFGVTFYTLSLIMPYARR